MKFTMALTLTPDQRAKVVLIVEDDRDLLSMFEMYLEGLGLTFLSAMNGEEAIEVLGKHKVDVLITDFQMPKVDGLELLKWCRENSFHFPVIFVSANSNLASPKNIELNDCCTTIVQKPL